MSRLGSQIWHRVISVLFLLPNLAEERGREAPATKLRRVRLGGNECRRIGEKVANQATTASEVSWSLSSEAKIENKLAQEDSPNNQEGRSRRGSQFGREALFVKNEKGFFISEDLIR